METGWQPMESSKIASIQDKSMRSVITAVGKARIQEISKVSLVESLSDPSVQVIEVHFEDGNQVEAALGFSPEMGSWRVFVVNSL